MSARAPARAALLLAGVLLTQLSCRPRVDEAAPKVLVLGFDGMDPEFVRRHADRLPNLMKLAEAEGFRELETVMPPQSPVAWSTVITGMTPGGHGVFDFVHRDPATIHPFSSMAEAIPPSRTLEIGDLVIPLDGGETIPLRKGQAFWELLREQGVGARILRMPTDYPPEPSSIGALSGMGTPDMLGSFGTFQFITDDPDEFRRATVSGGEIQRAHIERGRIEAELLGPINSFYADAPRASVPLVVELDEAHGAARIELGGELMVLQPGEWSEWIELDFELVPMMYSASGIVRLYLKQLDPYFKLYISPVNIDPSDPETPISEPDDFAAELAEELGPFYTQGMAEETKALSAGLFDREEFVAQAHLVFDESIEMYEHVFETWNSGLLFYYFSTTDQAAHMLWGDHEDKLLPIYEKADAVVGWTLERLGSEDLLLVISDHGFERFDREVHLNRWLMDEGFLTLDDPANVGETPGFVHVDWSQTQVYAMGLNGLYINRAGREGQGSVREEELEELEQRLEQRILEFVDPDTGERIVERLYRPRESFSGDQFELAPDFIVGFRPPYRMSPETGLGAVPKVAVEDNHDEWIGDHCMAHEAVPGVLFSNRPIVSEQPALADIPVTVLRAYGLDAPEHMVGHDVFSPDPSE